jgi:hypothetical protein
MKSKPHRSMLWFSVLALALGLPLFAATAAAQQSDDPTPREEGASLEENLRYGYSTNDGRLSLEANNLATFCPDAAVLAVHPDHTDKVLEQLNARDVGNGTWEVPDPETGKVVTAKVQYASSVYDDGSATAESLKEEKLPIVSTRAVAVVPILYPRCWALRFHHECGNFGNCGNGACLPGGFRFVQVRNFLVCRPQLWSICLEFLSPVCRLNRYFCRDCTGPIVAFWPSYRWVCAVF